MPWARLDDGIFDNPKIAALSDAAQLAHIKAIVYSARNLTDGEVGLRKAKEIATPKVIKELTPGLWEPTETGFRVHDYLKYNPSRDQVMREREAAKERMNAARSGRVRPNNGRTSHNPVPLPDPDPVPDPQKSQDVVVVDARDTDEVGKVMASFATFGTVNEYTVQCIEEAVEKYTLDWVKRAVKVAGISKASGDQPPWNYVERTLVRWKKRGEPDDDMGKELAPTANGTGTKKSLRFAG